MSWAGLCCFYYSRIIYRNLRLEKRTTVNEKLPKKLCVANEKTELKGSDFSFLLLGISKALKTSKLDL